MTTTKTTKLLALSVIGISLTACSTIATSTNENSDTWSALSKDPVSIGAAINGARVVLRDYDKKLSGADKTRRGFNLATIASTTYTAVGAALNVHNHNLIASTALTAILPSIEDNVQSHGSPETLGSAMTKTQCIVRAGSLALEPETLGAVSILRLKTKESGSGTYLEERAALAEYEAIAYQIVSGYGQVYIDYASNRTPARLSAENLTQALNVISPAEEEAKEQAETLMQGPAALTGDKKDFLARSTSLRTINISIQTAVIETTTKATMKAIGNCLEAS